MSFLFVVSTIFVSLFTLCECINNYFVTPYAGGVTFMGVNSVDGTPATSAAMQVTGGILINSNGDLCYCSSSTLRKVDSSTMTVVTLTSGFSSSYLWENTATDVFFTSGFSPGIVSKLQIGPPSTSTVVVRGNDGIPNKAAGTSAVLSSPACLVGDAFGNIFVTDKGNNLVRRISAGTYDVTNFAGTGGTSNGARLDGQATASTVNSPFGVAVDAEGNVFVSESTGSHLISKITTTGLITTVAGTGTAGSLGNGVAATNAQLNGPRSIWLDSVGSLFVADYTNKMIRAVDTLGGIIVTVLGSSTAASGSTGDFGYATAATVISPTYLTGDSAGNVYFVDKTGGVAVRRLSPVIPSAPPTATPTGNAQSIYSSYFVKTVAGEMLVAGSTGDGGPATLATLQTPHAVWVSPVTGTLYVADTDNYRIRQVDESGRISTLSGSAFARSDLSSVGDGGVPGSAYLGRPTGLWGDAQRNLYIVENLGNRLRKIDPTGSLITTVAGTVDGDFVDANRRRLLVLPADNTPATSATLNLPNSVAGDAAGNLYFTEAGTWTVRCVSLSTGLISTVAGNGASSDIAVGDGGPATAAALSHPFGVWVDSARNIYFTDIGVGRVRVVGFRTKFISTVAGGGSLSDSSSISDQVPSTAAVLSSPRGVAGDSQGNLFISDSNNFCVRMVNAGDRLIFTIAGSVTESGSSANNDISALSSLLGIPGGICVDTTGLVYFADSANQVVRVLYSTLPTSQPSASPSTSAPSCSPTFKPTSAPTITPSSKPTALPTITPTITPTISPTTSPTVKPSVSPTKSPTISPTTSPTVNPTTSPSVTPTVNPTTSPSVTPTVKPTTSPSVTPTVNPTTSPSITPTISPSVTPTVNPTTSPSITPTVNPTTSPSVTPTISPTISPSVTPTVNPSTSPSVTPTVAPTISPSVKPTINPSVTPTVNPSTSPSVTPTIKPTTSPSDMLSTVPSASPSEVPSESPITEPTTAPSGSPSATPTTAPSAVPSATPTAGPSTEPSASPSATPTTEPTTEPSASPSATPTTEPTTGPSASPSAMPTSEPTTGPSAMPSATPTAGPSTGPSASPSATPTSEPSAVPSAMPTSSPTTEPSASPSTTPTTEPTTGPSASPSATPTTAPSTAPSASPSETPTSEPSAVPSAMPTSSPTTEPSASPSATPTTEPTTGPSASPSATPTTEPTTEPSASPSASPSATPTTEPSTEPSASPSATPTTEPTTEPSASPSATPTTEPTTEPSASPSATPTTEPTTEPSALPSAMPTSSPTTEPSASPSAMPTSEPTTGPSASPSATPTTGPSTAPSASPSATPTTGPSASPSATPTSDPTTGPSARPSPAPSARPTVAPSARPSRSLTASASGSPSAFSGTNTSYSGAPTQSPTQSAESLWRSQLQGVLVSIGAQVLPSTAHQITYHELSVGQTNLLGGCSQWTSALQGDLFTSLFAYKPTRLQMTMSAALNSNVSVVCSDTAVLSKILSQLARPTAADSNVTLLCSGHRWVAKSCGALGVRALCADCADPCDITTRCAEEVENFGKLFSIAPCGLSSPCGAISSPSGSSFRVLNVQFEEHQPAPLIESISFVASKTAVVVDVRLSGPGTAHCGAFSADHQPASVDEIVSLGFTAQSVANTATVAVRHLTAGSVYSVFCAATSAMGATSTLAQVLATNTVARTECCKTATISLSSKVVVESQIVSNFVSVQLSGAPSSALAVTLSATLNTSSSSLPKAFFPSVLLATSLSPNVVLYSALHALSTAGEYSLAVTLSGESAEEYVVVLASPQFTVMSASQPLPAPKLSSAQFSADGSVLLVRFDSRTDLGGHTSSFACGELFNFTCAATSRCRFTDTSSVEAFVTDGGSASICARPPDTLRLAGSATLRAECVQTAGQNHCGPQSSWNVASAHHTVNIQSPANALSPVVVVSAPAVIGPCDSLVINIADSYGSGGRAWSRRSITVQSSGDTNGTATIQQFLDTRYEMLPPTPLPSSLLSVGATYYFVVTLCNFLSQCSQSSARVLVLDARVPSVSLAGQSSTQLTKVVRSDSLAITSTSSLSECDGGSVQASNLDLSYQWSVFSGGVQVLGLSSVSRDPSKLLLSPHTLLSGVTYDLVLTVTARSTAQSASASTKVLVLPGEVNAVIAGGSSRSVRPGEMLILNAASSRDEDESSPVGSENLSFVWKCVQSGLNLGEPCDSLLQLAELSSPVLQVFAPRNQSVDTLKATPSAEISVTVSDASGLRSAVARVSVSVLLPHAAVVAVSSNQPTGVMNAGQALQLTGSIDLPNQMGANVSWQVTGDDSFDLQAAALSAVTVSLSPLATDAQNATRLLYMAFPINSLPLGAALTFSLLCTVAGSGAQSVSSLTVVVNSPPHLGTFRVSPDSGEAVSQLFSFAAGQWVDSHLPLTYQFGYLSVSAGSSVVTLVSQSRKSFAETPLSAGAEGVGNMVTCVAQIFDSLEANATAQYQVRVTTALVWNASRIAEFMDSALQKNAARVDGIKQTISLTADLLNTAECTGGLACDSSLADREQKTTSREALLSSVSTLSAMEDPNPQSVVSQMGILAAVTQNHEELSESAVTLSVDVVSALLVSAAEVKLSVQESSPVLGAMDSLLMATSSTMNKQRRQLGSNEANGTTLAIESVLKHYSSQVADSLLPGLSAVSSAHKQFSLSTQVLSPGSSLVSPSLVGAPNKGGNSVTLGINSDRGTAVSVLTMDSQLFSEADQFLSNPFTMQLPSLPCISPPCAFTVVLHGVDLKVTSDAPEHFNTTCARGQQVEQQPYICANGVRMPEVECPLGEMSYTVHRQCPIITSSPVCNGLLSGLVSGESGCQVTASDANSVTCLCVLDDSHSRRALLTSGNSSSGSYSVSYVAMLTATTKTFVDTFSSAEDLNAGDIGKNWSVVVTIGVFAAAVLVALTASHFADVKEQQADKATKAVADSKRMQLAVQLFGSSGKVKPVTTSPNDAKSAKKHNRKRAAARQRKKLVNAELELVEQSLPQILSSSQSLSQKFVAEVKQHHRWLGVVFFFSESFPRALRVASLATNIIIMLFIQSITYNVTNPDDGSCELFDSEADCVAPRSSFATGQSKCAWVPGDSSSNGSCAYIQPDGSMKIVLFVAIFSAIVSTPIALTADWVLHKIISAPVQSSGGYKRKIRTSSVDSTTGRGRLDSSNTGNRSRVGTDTSIHMRGRTRTDSSQLREAELCRDAAAATSNADDQPASMFKRLGSVFSGGGGTTRSTTTGLANYQVELTHLSNEIRVHREGLETHQKTEFDAVWGLDENGCFLTGDASEGGVWTKMMSWIRSKPAARQSKVNVHQAVLMDLKQVEQSVDRELARFPGATEYSLDSADSTDPTAAVVSSSTNNYKNKALAKRLLFLFQCDLLPGISGQILQSKGSRDQATVQPVSRAAHTAGCVALIGANAGMLFYIFLFAMQQSSHRQSAWFQSFMVWLIVEILFVSTAIVFLMHVVVPSLIMKDVAKIKSRLLENIRDFHLRISHKSEADANGQCVALTNQPFNAAKYLFVSTRVAAHHPEVREAAIISQFSTPWPKQSYQHVKNVSKAYSKKFTAVSRSVSIIVLFFVTNLLNVPPSLQDMVVHMVTTTTIGYTALLHIQLFGIFPVLAFGPFIVLCVIVHFVIQSGKASAKKRLAQLLPAPAGLTKTHDSGSKREAVFIANDAAPVGATDDTAGGTHVNRRQSVVQGVRVLQSLARHDQAEGGGGGDICDDDDEGVSDWDMESCFSDVSDGSFEQGGDEEPLEQQSPYAGGKVRSMSLHLPLEEESTEDCKGQQQPRQPPLDCDLDSDALSEFSVSVSEEEEESRHCDAKLCCGR